MSEDGEISRSTGAISIGSARDRLTFAERLQTVIGYPEAEEVIGGNEAVVISIIQHIPAWSCLILLLSIIRLFVLVDSFISYTRTFIHDTEPYLLLC